MGTASITIRDLDEDAKIRPCTRTTGDRRSIAGEERQIPSEAAAGEAEPNNRATFIRACIAPFGGVEREMPPRGQMREPPRFVSCQMTNGGLVNFRVAIA